MERLIRTIFNSGVLMQNESKVREWLTSDHHATQVTEQSMLDGVKMDILLKFHQNCFIYSELKRLKAIMENTLT